MNSINDLFASDRKALIRSHRIAATRVSDNQVTVPKLTIHLSSPNDTADQDIDGAKVNYKTL